MTARTATRLLMDTPRSRLLYLSPVVPADTGNGLAMRAGLVLRLLARHHRVSLLVVRLYAPFETPIPMEIAALCDRAIAIPARRPVTPPPTPPLDRLRALIARVRRGYPRPPAGGALATDRPFGRERFDVVHVFRLAMLPYARPYLDRPGPTPKRHLDLDDVESTTRRRLAALYASNGHAALAQHEAGEARRAEALEADVLRSFDRLYVCSEEDRAGLVRPGGAQVCVLPNALPHPEPLPPSPDPRPFTFLFIGTLGYYPNEDAVNFFCTEVLPLIRRATDQKVRVTIVGAGATPAVRRLAEAPDVLLIGAVPDVATAYREADAVVVPIRAGGGTRIKVLEAFSYRRPVVSTSVGIEGIAARPEEHFLLGDTPAELADQCARLMANPSLAVRLAEAGHALFSSAYTIEAAAQRLASCIGEANPL